MNRLWVQLSLAFALVVLLTVGTIALLADMTAGQAFRRYLSYSDRSLHQPIIDRLVAYYQENGSWDGLQVVLVQREMMPWPMPGSMQPRQPPGDNRQDPRFQIVVADADGRVVYDTHEERKGQKLTREEKAAAQDIELDGEVIGKLVIALPIQEAILGPLEQNFVSRLRGILVMGTLVAGAIGVGLGLAISRNLTAPLQRLATAARAVANRDFSRRVEVEGSAELAEVGQAFNDMASTLEKAEKLRQNMVADVAHELRAPLSVVQGNLQAILDDVYPLDKAEVTRLYDETRLLSRLVDDLRDLALADAGQLRLNVQPTDVAHVIQTTADNLSLAAEAQDVSLDVQAAEDLPLVAVDPDRLAQVLRNLLINALRHTPEAGSVTVAVARNEDALVIEVADTGEGIAPEDLPYIFDRFWRADQARTRTGRTGAARWESGSGLGLSVAQSLVQAHGGRIWAESVLGQGTTFRFTLPLAPGEP